VKAAAGWIDDFAKPMAARVYGDAGLPIAVRNAAALARYIVKDHPKNAAPLLIQSIGKLASSVCGYSRAAARWQARGFYPPVFRTHSVRFENKTFKPLKNGARASQQRTSLACKFPVNAHLQGKFQ
jgi:hypothetical protein